MSEDSKSEENQDTGDDSPPSSSDETDVEIRKAEHLTAHFKIQELRRPRIKKEEGNFPAEKKEWKRKSS